MEAPAPISTPTDPPPTSTSSDLLPPPPSTDPPPTVPPTEPPPLVSSAAPSTNPSSIASQIQSQAQSQTLEPEQQPQPQQQQPQQSQPQSQPQPPQRPPPANPRPRPPTQPITRGGGGGMALGVPAGYSHHQRPQSGGPYSSFRPSNPFGAPPPSFVQPFAGMPRTSAGGPEHNSSSNAQARPPIPSVQTIGMIGSLSATPAASQMRPGGVPVQNQQRLGQPQVRSASPSTNQALNSQQRFPSHLGPRAPSMTSPSSQSPGPQSSQSLQQQWLSAQGKQTHAASLPSSSYRPQTRPPTMQQRPQQPQQLQQQHQLPITSHLQVSAPQQQQQQKQHQLQQLQQMQQQQQQQHNSLPNQSQEHHPLRNQQSIPPQHQTARGLVPTTAKSNVQAVAHPGLATSTNYNDPDELRNDIISRKRIRELVTQVDRSEKLRPEIEDDLLEIADDFIENIVTAACHLAKHRKSTTLEAKDILLHVERHWNMTLPGFSGDEIKCYKKPSTNDIHKERLAMIKKSMVGTNEGGNAKTPASTVGQAAANPKLHSAKTPAMGSPKAREPP